MKKLKLFIFLIAIIGFSSCKKIDYSAFEGRWYNTSRSWYIDFSGNSFHGENQGHYFKGTHLVKGKKIFFKFSDEPPIGQEVFYDFFKRIDSYNIGKSQLNLYGPGFQIYLIK
jgi:hypothetical protein